MERKYGAIKVRDFDLDIKAAGESGLFSGYGSVFGNVDAYKEIVMPGAFTRSLEELERKGRKVPVLWSHQMDEPIGVYNNLQEDDHGLKVEGQLLIDSDPQAKRIHAHLVAGSVSGLSIGYRVRKSSYDEETRVRSLLDLDLVEISLVTNPANDDARIDTVKMKLAHGDLPTLSEFEGILREAGFSKSQSAVVANRGLSHLLRSESGKSANEPEAINKVISSIENFQLPNFG